jgi:small subunit ribosomal protein S5
VSKPPFNKKGRPVREAKEFDEEVIQIDRVTRVVKGGRRLRFRATVVVGNRKGKVGYGIGKSTEVQGAIQKAITQAKKSMITVPIVGQTIPHRIKMKYKSARLLIMPACPGTGIIAGGPLRKVIELAGYKDVLSKSLGCNNRVTNTQAAYLALSSLKDLPWIKKKAPEVVAPKSIPTELRKDFRKPADSRPTNATSPATPARPTMTAKPAQATVAKTVTAAKPVATHSVTPAKPATEDKPVK